MVQENGLSLQCVPEKHRTAEVCLAAVQEDGRALEHVPERLRTEEICLAAVREDGGALQYVPEELRTEALCESAFATDAHAFRFFPERLKTPPRCRRAVAEVPELLRHVPTVNRTRELSTWALERAPGLLADVPEKYLEEDLVLRVWRRCPTKKVWDAVPSRLRTPAFVRQAMGLLKIGNVQSFLFLSDLMEDGFLDQLLELQPTLISHLSPVQRTPERLIRAVQLSDKAFTSLAVPDLTEEVCEAAVARSATLLFKVPDFLQTETMCRLAVRSNGSSIAAVRPDLQTEELCVMAVSTRGTLLRKVHPDKRTVRVCEAAVETDGLALEHVPQALRTSSVELCRKAVEDNAYALRFVPKGILAEVPQLYQQALRGEKGSYYQAYEVLAMYLEKVFPLSAVLEYFDVRRSAASVPCCICREAPEEKEDICRHRNCPEDHHMHLGCAERWINSCLQEDLRSPSCPVCRRDLFE